LRELVYSHNCKQIVRILAIVPASAIAACKIRVKWPVVAILLYSSLAVVVFMPLVFVIACWFGQPDNIDPSDVPEFLRLLYTRAWPFWLFSGILIICQMTLLIMSVRVVKEKLKPQKGVWMTAIAAAALFAILFLGIVLSISAAIWGDNIPDMIGWFSLVFIMGNWLIWTWVFRCFARNRDARSYTRRLMKWLLRGSILELLIAVPSHIIVRQKDVCCAHGLTAAGLATGLAIMLISFGPGIYFLYAERILSKKANLTETNESDIADESQ
jgi:hypothetical protein